MERFAQAKEQILIEKKKVMEKICRENKIKFNIEEEGGVIFRNKRIFLFGEINKDKNSRLEKIRDQLRGI